MPTSLKTTVLSYFRAGNPAIGTRKEYLSTVRKWNEWGGGVPVEQLTRREIREFLDWVHERAIQNEGSKPGRTANKARENLRAIMTRSDRGAAPIDTPSRSMTSAGCVFIGQVVLLSGLFAATTAARLA